MTIGTHRGTLYAGFRRFLSAVYTRMKRKTASTFSAAVEASPGRNMALT
jgi:hypothetical protein